MRKVIALAILAVFFWGCGEKVGWNLSRKELEKRRPKTAAEQAEPEIVSLLALQNKLLMAIQYIHKDLISVGVPPDPSDALDAIGYAREFVLQSSQQLKKIRDLARQNRREVDETLKEYQELKPEVLGTLVTLKTVNESEVIASYESYLDSLRNYLDAGEKKGNYIRKNFDEILLASPAALQGLDAFNQEYDKSLADMEKAYNDYTSERDTAVAKARRNVFGRDTVPKK
ncbi:MAG: hypothetical protein AB1921_04740 [Thermodesulfobacteriota bacterium]